MAIQPRAAIGVSFLLNDGLGNYTRVGGLETMTFDYKAVTVDVTDQDAPNRTMKRFPVLIDPGNIKAPIIFDPLDAIHASLRALMNTLQPLDWKFISPPSVSPPERRIYHAAIDDLSETYAVNNVIRANFSLVNTSAPNFAA